MATRLFERTAVCVLLLAASPAAWARQIPRLSELVRSQLQSVPQSVDACLLNPEGQGYDDGDWEATTFFLDVTPYVAVGISSVFQATVTPEIIFIWSRDDGS